MASSYRANGNLQRRNGRRSTTPVLLTGYRLPTGLQPELVLAVYHGHVLDRTAFPLGDLERVHALAARWPGTRARAHAGRL